MSFVITGAKAACLQLGLELLHLLLEALNSLSPLAAGIAEVEGGLAGEGVDGAISAQDPQLAGALATKACGAQGHPRAVVLLDVVPLQGRFPLAPLHPCMDGICCV